MQAVLTPPPLSSSDVVLAGHASGVDRQRQRTPQTHVDQQFVAMLDAYRSSGGIGRAQEILKMLKSHAESPGAMLAHWILKRKVICFEWRAQSWLPWFQFRTDDMRPHTELAPVLAELAPVFDPWELANWFAQPSPWLADCTPVDSLRFNLRGVLHAAQADRIVACG